MKTFGQGEAGHVPQSRARVALRRPVAVSQVLGPLLKRHGLDKKIARYEFVRRWPEIVGEEISKRTRPECFRGNTLVVRVCNSVWAQELSFYKQVILKRLRRHLTQGQVVDDLLFQVGF